MNNLSQTFLTYSIGSNTQHHSPPTDIKCKSKISVIFTDELNNETKMTNNNIEEPRCSVYSLPDYLRLPKIPEITDEKDMRKKKKSKYQL